MASYIPHPEAFVHNFLQVIDIVLLMGQNKNTLACVNFTLDTQGEISYVKKKEVLSGKVECLSCRRNEKYQWFLVLKQGGG